MAKRVDWSISKNTVANNRFERYLRGLGYQESTILDYVGRCERYLSFCGTTEPNEEHATKFRETLIDRRLSRSSINNYSFVIKAYHRMLGNPVELPHLKMSNKLPYVFDEDDI
jgi:hypothetical protein